MSELTDAAELARQIGPFPQPFECGAFGYQLKSWLDDMDRGRKFETFQESERDQIRSGVARWILEGTRLRADRHGGYGAYMRKFHQDPFEAGDVRRLIAKWTWEAW